MAKSDNKPKGKRTAYMFFQESCRIEIKRENPEQIINFREFSKKCGLDWKALPAIHKKTFQSMAEKDKTRYEDEMKDYVPTKGQKVKGGKEKRKFKEAKDPNKPKRALSSFFWFCQDERSKVRDANPNFAMTDIGRELGRLWKLVDEKDKTKYEELAAKDKERYRIEIEAYNNKAEAQAADADEEEMEEEEAEEGSEEESE